MSVKAIEMVRKIRDKHFEETRDLPIESQLRYIKEKSKYLSDLIFLQLTKLQMNSNQALPASPFPPAKPALHSQRATTD